MHTDADALIKEFYMQKRPLSYTKGETLILPDTTKLPPITYIEEGVIEQYDITDEGQKVVVNIFKPGAFFPASSAINHTFNTYYFEAIENVTVRQAVAEEVEALLLAHPVIVYDLLKRLYRGVDGILLKLSSSLSLTAKQRIMNELTIYGQRFGVKQADQSVALSLTIEQIAQRTGLARETASRELKKLQVEGVIGMKRGKMMLLHHKNDTNHL